MRHVLFAHLRLGVCVLLLVALLFLTLDAQHVTSTSSSSDTPFSPHSQAQLGSGSGSNGNPSKGGAGGAGTTPRQPMQLDPRAPDCWARSTRAPAATRAVVWLALKQRNINLLTGLRDRIVDPTNRAYHQFLSTTAIHALIDPTDDDKAKVLATLRTYGITSQYLTDMGDALRIDTRVQLLERMFNTTFHSWINACTGDKPIVRSNGDFSLPPSLVPFVDLVGDVFSFPVPASIYMVARDTQASLATRFPTLASMLANVCAMSTNSSTSTFSSSSSPGSNSFGSGPLDWADYVSYSSYDLYNSYDSDALNRGTTSSTSASTSGSNGGSSGSNNIKDKDDDDDNSGGNSGNNNNFFSGSTWSSPSPDSAIDSRRVPNVPLNLTLLIDTVGVLNLDSGYRSLASNSSLALSARDPLPPASATSDLFALRNARVDAGLTADLDLDARILKATQTKLRVFTPGSSGYTGFFGALQTLFNTNVLAPVIVIPYALRESDILRYEGTPPDMFLSRLDRELLKLSVLGITIVAPVGDTPCTSCSAGTCPTPSAWQGAAASCPPMRSCQSSQCSETSSNVTSVGSALFAPTFPASSPHVTAVGSVIQASVCANPASSAAAASSSTSPSPSSSSTATTTPARSSSAPFFSFSSASWPSFQRSSSSSTAGASPSSSSSSSSSSTTCARNLSYTAMVPPMSSVDVRGAVSTVLLGSRLQQRAVRAYNDAILSGAGILRSNSSVQARPACYDAYRTANSTLRATPDVSMLGASYANFGQGIGWAGVYGARFSAITFAAVVSRALRARSPTSLPLSSYAGSSSEGGGGSSGGGSSGGSNAVRCSLGWINPLLYELAAISSLSSARLFSANLTLLSSPYTSGVSNPRVCADSACTGATSTCFAFATNATWNPLTGLGVPSFPALVAAFDLSDSLSSVRRSGSSSSSASSSSSVTLPSSLSSVLRG